MGGGLGREDGEAGEGGYQFLGVGMLGGTEDLGRGAALDDFAGIEDGDAMAECGDGEQVVGYIKDAHAEFAIKAGEEGEDFGLGDGIEGAGGFVGDEKGRTVEDGHGDDDALGLADAELRGAAAEKVGGVGETDACQRVADGRGALFARADSMSAPGLAELGADAQGWIEGGQRTLQDDADFAATERAHLGFGFCGEVFAFEEKSAAGRAAFQMKEAENGERDGALAGPALANQTEDFAGLEGERDVAEHSGIVAIVDGETERE
jgi:hypothetical protein